MLKADRIRIYIFTIALSLFGVLCITQLINSERWRVFIGAVAVILVIIIDVFLIKKSTNTEKFSVKKLDFITILMLIVIFSVLLKNIVIVSARMEGNNINSLYYEKSIGGKGENSIEKIVEKREVDDLKQFFTAEEGKYMTVFYHDETRIAAIDLYKENGKYYYAGERILIYAGDLIKNEHDTTQTIKADVSESLIRAELLDINGERISAWGVVEGKEIKSINQKNIDTEIKIRGEDGRNYTFWYIKDIGTVKSVNTISITEKY